MTLVRACAITLTVVVCTAASLARSRQDVGPPRSAEALYEIYRQGQRDLVFRMIQTREDWDALDAGAFRLADRWLNESRRAEPTWAPSRVAFLLELGSLGGRLTAVGPNDNLSRAFVDALDTFRQSYVLRYSLDEEAEPGWHDVAVRVLRPGRFEVRARRGYTAAAPR